MIGLLFIGTASVLVAILVWIAQRLGRARAERDFYAGEERNAGKAQEIDERVAGLGAGELDRRLRPFRRE